MAGWIAIIGECPDFSHRVSRFHSRFSLEGVPGLRLETPAEKNGLSLLLWAWNPQEIPDIHFFKDSGDRMWLLSGAVTGLGPHVNAAPSQQEALQRITDGWLAKGESVAKEINGSFSLLRFDPLAKECQVFTDRFASQSVWMSCENDRWLVGNFPSALAVMREGKPGFDPAGLWSLLHTGRHVGLHGVFTGISCLPAGKRAILVPGQTPRIDSWWERRYQPQTGISRREWGERIAAGLRRSSERYRGTMANPHLFLSGGLDSRIAAAALGRPLKAVTLCTMPNAESKIAGRVSRVLELEHRVIVRSPYWVLDAMEAAALVSSGNHLVHHAHFIVPIQRVLDEAPNAEFLLGDLLENFNKHYFHIPQGMDFTWDPETLAERLPLLVPSTVRDPGRLGIHMRAEFREKCKKRYHETFREAASAAAQVSSELSDRMDTLLRWADVNVTYTYNMITCMWPLARQRNLMFDNDLNDLSLSIPADLRGSGKLHRWTLFHLCRALGRIPDANSFLPPYVPGPLKFVARKVRPIVGKIRRSLRGGSGQSIVLNTSGSWLLLHEMYRKDDRYRRSIEALIDERSAFPEEVFDRRQIQNTWDRYLAGDISLHMELEAILSIGRLCRQMEMAG